MFEGTYVLIMLVKLISVSCLVVATMSEDPVREWILTQHRKGNAHNCGLGVSPSQETAHLKHMEEKGLSYCMHTIT
jgi:hypothetical protein